MNPLTSQDIESELSYAYLHAVAASAGVACTSSGRLTDKSGVDAHLTGWGPFPGGILTEIDIDVQLKATTKTPALVGDAWSYFIDDVSRYDKLRRETTAVPRILAVLFLPKEEVEWLVHTEDMLTLRRCAYWVSLRGAPATSNKSGQTVYLPRTQRFDKAGLHTLMSRISRHDIPQYTPSQVAP